VDVKWKGILIAEIIILSARTINVKSTERRSGYKMRRGCPYCVRKHLAQASVLLDEVLFGYPHHRWLAVGHLAEAEVECVELYPEFAQKIREVRLDVMHAKENPIIEELLLEFLELIGEKVEFPKMNSKKYGHKWRKEDANIRER